MRRGKEHLIGAEVARPPTCIEGSRIVSDLIALRQRREQPFFAAWSGHVHQAHIAAAEDSIRQLIDSVIARDVNPSKNDVRSAVVGCVLRFNQLDDGWIMTIEREDIVDAIGAVTKLTGFQCDDEWIEDREW
jgi:hypothetical protein